MTEITPDLAKAVAGSGLCNGMRISFHHHLRLGDRVMQTVLPVLERMGFKDLTLSLSSVMGEACVAVTDAVRSGLVRQIETTGMKEPLSGAVLRGEVPEPVVFRTHGGRALAIESGRTPVDVAFIAASAADRVGNLTGTDGRNRFGSLGYAMVDAEHAAHVIAITDTLADNPLSHVSIHAHQVDRVVTVDSIGERSLMSGGSLRQSTRPIEHLIAKKTAAVLDACDVVRDDFAYQSGSGGVSLLVTGMLAGLMRERGITGSFASGGVTGALVDALKEGLFRELYDVQSFDDAAAQSLGRNGAHHEMSAAQYASPSREHCIAHRLDVMILSGTEIDVNLNLNSLTGTNGRILGALGGAPDTAEGAGLTVAVMPTMRGRIPTLNESVRTVCTQGEFVDLLVTERGVCVNPRREDLATRLHDAGLATVPVRQLMETVHRITGTPRIPERGARTVGMVEERRGTALDTISGIDS